MRVAFQNLTMGISRMQTSGDEECLEFPLTKSHEDLWAQETEKNKFKWQNAHKSQTADSQMENCSEEELLKVRI